MTEADDAFGPNVRDVRSMAGLSQEALATKVSERGRRFHQTTINKIERGERRVTLGEAIDIAEALQVPLADLASRAPRSIAFQLRSLQTGVHVLREHLGDASEVVYEVDAMRDRLTDTLTELEKAIENNVAVTKEQRWDIERLREVLDVVSLIEAKEILDRVWEDLR